MGYERRYNPSLQFTDLQAFIEHMLFDQPPRPANMANIVAINQGKRPYTSGRPFIPIIDPREAARLIDSGHSVVDARAFEPYSAGHVPGACNVQLLDPSFEQNIGWTRSGDRPFVLVGDSPGQASMAAKKLAFVGLDGVAAGFVVHEDWVRAGLPVAGLAQIAVDELAREVQAGRVRLLDVREVSEWRSGHIETAVHASFKQLTQGSGEIPVGTEEPVAVICAAGTRSSMACGLLRNRGFQHVLNVPGGMDAWRAAGLPVVLP